MKLEIIEAVADRAEAYAAMVAKTNRNDRRKALAFDLLKNASYVQRDKAATALRIARRLI